MSVSDETYKRWQAKCDRDRGYWTWDRDGIVWHPPQKETAPGTETAKGDGE